MLRLWPYAYDHVNPYVAGLTSFISFAFVLCLCLCSCSRVNQDLDAIEDSSITRNDSYIFLSQPKIVWRYLVYDHLAIANLK